MSDSDTPRYSPPVSTDIEGDNVPPNIPSVPLAGNTADDDGSAIDAFFEGMPVGPQQFEGAVHTQENLPQTHRLLSRTLPVTPEPIQFFPPDPRRTTVTVQVEGALVDVGTSYGIQIASSKSDCYGAAILFAESTDSAGTVTPNNQLFTLSDYTGPIWIRVPDEWAGLTIRASVWCVTF